MNGVYVAFTVSLASSETFFCDENEMHMIEDAPESLVPSFGKVFMCARKTIDTNIYVYP